MANTITFAPQEQVRIPFQIEDYSDCLYKTPEEYAASTSESLEAEMQARYDNWLAVINAPRPEPTTEQIAAQVDAMVEQQRITQDQIVALSPDNVLLPILEGQAAVIAEQIAAVMLNEAAGRG